MAPGGSKNYGWDTGPKLDEARFLAPDEPRPVPGKKNRRRWCRGKVGVEHVTEIKFGHKMRLSRKPRCEYWRWSREPWWHCDHSEVCIDCGKILRDSLGRDCPDWRPRPELPQVEIDLNVRVRGNQTFVGRKNVDRPLRIGDLVEVYESESGIRGPGKVVAIEPSNNPKHRRAAYHDLVYLSVDWKALRLPHEEEHD